MILCLLIAIVLWTYPIGANLFIRFTAKAPDLRRKVWYILIVISLLTILFSWAAICTRWSLVDWVFVSVIYFLLLTGFWWTQLSSTTVVKLIFLLPGYVLLAVNYLMGTVGLLGAVAIETYYPKKVVWVNDQLSVREYRRGSVFDDYREMKAEVYRTVPYMPLLQRQVCKKTYRSMVAYGNRLDLHYNAEKKELYYTGYNPWKMADMKVYWRDTLRLP